ncbi:hypothetical protein DOZ91_05225 [Peribacillus frigoritolerans]|nr:hypothetical protein DOZ91_05225 [Peribacillus frigoritolerans]
MRDSCGKSEFRGDPEGAEEAPGPPAESECLEGKSTFKLYKSLKFNRVCLQTEHPESLDAGCFLYGKYINIIKFSRTYIVSIIFQFFCLIPVQINDGCV